MLNHIDFYKWSNQCIVFSTHVFHACDYVDSFDNKSVISHKILINICKWINSALLYIFSVTVNHFIPFGLNKHQRITRYFGKEFFFSSLKVVFIYIFPFGYSMK